MFSRRKFISRTAFSSLGVALGILSPSCVNSKPEESGTLYPEKTGFPMVISTWENLEANKAAMAVIEKNGSAVDAVEAGVRIPEADPNDPSVGYGGRPDRNGNVTLDACIMDSNGNGGSVCFLQHIKHPISVARKVMDDTPHVILAGRSSSSYFIVDV